MRISQEKKPQSPPNQTIEPADLIIEYAKNLIEKSGFHPKNMLEVMSLMQPKTTPTAYFNGIIRASVNAIISSKTRIFINNNIKTLELVTRVLASLKAINNPVCNGVKLEDLTQLFSPENAELKKPILEFCASELTAEELEQIQKTNDEFYDWFLKKNPRCNDTKEDTNQLKKELLKRLERKLALLNKIEINDELVNTITTIHQLITSNETDITKKKQMEHLEPKIKGIIFDHIMTVYIVYDDQSPQLKFLPEKENELIAFYKKLYDTTEISAQQEKKIRSTLHDRLIITPLINACEEYKRSTYPLFRTNESNRLLNTLYTTLKCTSDDPEKQRSGLRRDLVGIKGKKGFEIFAKFLICNGVLDNEERLSEKLFSEKTHNNERKYTP